MLKLALYINLLTHYAKGISLLIKIPNTYKH